MLKRCKQAKDKDEMEGYFKTVLKVDPAQNPADFTLRGRLTMLWEACRTRAEVETKAVAERAQALEMRVLGYDPFFSASRAAEVGVEMFDDVDAMLPEIDYLTVHPHHKR